jgi:ribosomal protein S18 acetylase RimI-like enzyme
MLVLPPSLVEKGLGLRVREERDRPFLRALFGSARVDAEILAQWPAEQREPFLDQQFRFQTAHFDQAYPDADNFVIELDGTPIGRLILGRGPGDWEVIDIAFAPAARGHGIGQALLEAVQAATAAAGAPGISLMVQHGNRAQNLYRRLGFALGEDTGSHIAMRWTAAS